MFVELPLPLGGATSREGWGEGFINPSTMIRFWLRLTLPPHPCLLPEGEGVNRVLEIKLQCIFADWVWIIHYRYAEISLIYYRP